jgi:hypothetical protein
LDRYKGSFPVVGGEVYAICEGASHKWFDVDGGSSQCAELNQMWPGRFNWIIGESTAGEYGSTANGGSAVYGGNECCGDDSSEFYRVRNLYSVAPWIVNWANNPADDACCNNANDCVVDAKCFSQADIKDYRRNWSGTDMVAGCDIAATGKWFDLDGGPQYCDGSSMNQPTNLNWIKGGESAAFGEYDTGISTECCGDDAGEYQRAKDFYTTKYSSAYYINWVSAPSDRACCNNANDCVVDGVCTSQGAIKDYRGTPWSGPEMVTKCDPEPTGQWFDIDSAQNWCETGTGLTWAATGEGALSFGEYGLATNGGNGITECCGDDSGEYYNYKAGWPTGRWDIAWANNSGDDACCSNSNNDCVASGTCYSQTQVNSALNPGGMDNIAECDPAPTGLWFDVDGNRSYCLDIPGGQWVLTGEAGVGEYGVDKSNGGVTGVPEECCGDDAGEFYKINPVNPSIEACCSGVNDCVASNGICISSTGIESIAQGNCADGIDNDCDGEDDWDTEPARGTAHGDDGCPVGVIGVPAVSNLNPSANSVINITCTVNAGNVQVNSVFAYIDNDSSGTYTPGDHDCGWSPPRDSWISNTQKRFVDCSVGGAGNKNATCGVYSSLSEPYDRSYQIGNDVVRAITVASSACSNYITQVACQLDINCKWVLECKGAGLSPQYSGDIGRCVPIAQPIPYQCSVSKCSEQCEGGNLTNCIGLGKTFNCASYRYQTRATSCNATCLCNYTSWSNQSCALSKANCGATCGAGETTSCTTSLGYPGIQNCNESNCDWNATCYTDLYCGDGKVNGTEECDTALLTPPFYCTGNIGKFCNSTCQNQTSIPESICNDGIDNDCDGLIDGCDANCFEGWSNDYSENKRCCADESNNDGVNGRDKDDYGCCDLCTGINLTTSQIMIFENNNHNSNYFGDSCGVSFSDWQTYNGGVFLEECCGNDEGEYYKNITIGPTTYHACCNSTLSCVNQTGACQVGIENTITLCTNDKDDDCDGLIDITDPDCSGLISGHVYDERLNPIMGAIVKGNPPGSPAQYQSQSQPTDYMGYYALSAFTGNYSFIARKEGYDDNVTFLNINSNSVINNLNFVLRNGSCHADCTDYYGNCNPACNGTTFNTSTGPHTCNITTPECYYRPKGFRATQKIYDPYNHENEVIISQYTCCEGTAINYTARKATITGNAENLVISSYKVKKGEEVIEMKIAYWKNLIK